MKLIQVDPESKFARPTGLGLLLLGQNPQLHFPQSRVKFTIRNIDAEPIIKDFDGPLILMPEKIEEYLEIVFPKGFSRTSFKRTEKVEASYTAILEVIMNALVHRDYTIEGARIMVDIDEDKVVVSSPGEPLCEVSKLNDFSAPSFSRNAKIAHIFHKMGFVEERGFGMEELSKIEKYGLARPVFTQENIFLKTTLFRNIDSSRQIFEKTDLPGLKLLKEHRRLSTKEYANLINRTERTSLRHLSDLVANGLAVKEGIYYVYKS